MSEIALYEVLKQIPNVTDEQAKAAVVDVAKKEEVATKLDIARVEAAISNIQTELKAELKADIANLETRLTNRMYSMAGLIVGTIGLMFVIAGFIIKAL